MFRFRNPALRSPPRNIMSDLSKPGAAAPASSGLWLAIKKAAGRLQDWFVVQPLGVKLTVLAITVLIPTSAVYSLALLQKQAALAEQLKAMTVAEMAGDGCGRSTIGCRWCLAPARCSASSKRTRSSASP
jgi:hypothetical protein